MHVYDFSLDRDDEGEVFINFHSLPEILITVTEEELHNRSAFTIALNAVMNALQTRIDYADDLPEVAPNVTADIIAVSPIVSAKLTLYEEMQKRKLSKAALSQELVVSATDVQRLLNLFNDSRSEQLTSAFDKLGLQLRTLTSAERRCEPKGEVPINSNVTKTAS